MTYSIYMNNNYIQHWSISGQKWGVRRYQNEDGTLTEEGKKRYANSYSYKVGSKRLDKRTLRLEKSLRKNSKKMSYNKKAHNKVTNDSTELSITNAIKHDPRQIKKFGTKTIATRAVSSIATVAAVGAQAVATATNPLYGVVALPVTSLTAINAGKKFVKSWS